MRRITGWPHEDTPIAKRQALHLNGQLGGLNGGTPRPHPPREDRKRRPPGEAVGGAEEGGAGFGEWAMGAASVPGGRTRAQLTGSAP